MYFLFIVILFAQVIRPEAKEELPSLKTAGLTGLTVEEEKFYDGNSLWGYMDGGADLYIEYGFEKLLHQEVVYNNLKFKVDIFKMADAESAFGIFSVFCYKCSGYDPEQRFSCISKYQYQCAAGGFYISIINNSGDEAASKAALELKKNLLSGIEIKPPDIPGIFAGPLFSGELARLKFYKGILGIQNGIPEWEGYFSDAGGYSFFNLQAELDGEEYNLAYVVVGNEPEYWKLIHSLKLEAGQGSKVFTSKQKGKIIKAWQIKPGEFILLETEEKTGGNSRIEKAVDDFILSGRN
jgi:hypothetical protein